MPFCTAKPARRCVGLQLAVIGDILLLTQPSTVNRKLSAVFPVALTSAFS
jgi:hypothetical protein